MDPVCAMSAWQSEIVACAGSGAGPSLDHFTLRSEPGRALRSMGASWTKISPSGNDVSTCSSATRVASAFDVSTSSVRLPVHSAWNRPNTSVMGVKMVPWPLGCASGGDGRRSPSRMRPRMRSREVLDGAIRPPPYIAERFGRQRRRFARARPVLQRVESRSLQAERVQHAHNRLADAAEETEASAAHHYPAPHFETNALEPAAGARLHRVAAVVQQVPMQF